MNKNMKQYWCWIELIGFDKDLPDCGAGKFLRRFGKGLSGVSLLFADIGFVVSHEGCPDKLLRPCDCAYGAKPHNGERARQDWTAGDVCRLVSAFHTRGVKVYYSFFDFFTYTDDNGEFVTEKFCAAHKELWGSGLGPDGKPSVALNVLGRFADGRYFYEFLFDKMLEAAKFYGFDGIQVADGISGSRPSLQNSGSYDAAAPYETITASARAWRGFYAALYRAFEGSGIELMFNSEWGRGPFEALYRYGIDYKDTIGAGSGAVMVEEVSVTCALLSDEGRGGFAVSDSMRDRYHYEFFLTQTAIKARIPRTEQITLTPIKDTTENWDVISTAPGELSRAVFRRNNAFVYTGGGLERVSAGPLYCLSDNVKRNEWAWLKNLENIKLKNIKDVCGLVVYWHDELDSELKTYIDTRNYTAAELYAEAMCGGVCVAAAANREGLKFVNAPLLIGNPQFLTDAEVKAVRALKTPVVTLGGKRGCLGSSSDFTLDGCLTLDVYNAPGIMEMDADELIRAARASKVIACDPSPQDAHGALWTSPLKYNRLPAAFFRALSGFLNGVFGFPHAINDPDGKCKVSGYITGAGKYALFVSGDARFYTNPEIRIPGKKILKARSLLGHCGRVRADGDTVEFALPPRSMEVLELWLS
ncbi:MAG: hypothetical protein FWE62_01255 [Firmicutes bacterium]|nr:hypothetical protein [Bacillota bacterium]